MAGYKRVNIDRVIMNPMQCLYNNNGEFVGYLYTLRDLRGTRGCLRKYVRDSKGRKVPTREKLDVIYTMYGVHEVKEWVDLCMLFIRNHVLHAAFYDTKMYIIEHADMLRKKGEILNKPEDVDVLAISALIDDRYYDWLDGTTTFERLQKAEQERLAELAAAKKNNDHR